MPEPSKRNSWKREKLYRIFQEKQKTGKYFLSNIVGDRILNSVVFQNHFCKHFHGWQMHAAFYQQDIIESSVSPIFRVCFPNDQAF